MWLGSSFVSHATGSPGHAGVELGSGVGVEKRGNAFSCPKVAAGLLPLVASGAGVGGIGDVTQSAQVS